MSSIITTGGKYLIEYDDHHQSSHHQPPTGQLQQYQHHHHHHHLNGGGRQAIMSAGGGGGGKDLQQQQQESLAAVHASNVKTQQAMSEQRVERKVALRDGSGSGGGGGRPAAAAVRKWRIHLNNLWSFWYGVFGTVLQAYIAIKCIKRILGYSLLVWPELYPLPVFELNVSLGLTAAAILLIPFFLFSAAFKIGNLANDGFKLGRNLNACSKDPPVVPDGSTGGCSVFRHGGPTAAFLHLVIAFCLLLPKLLMEAKLIEADLLPKESVWHTDLDFMVLHRDRLVVLRFMTATQSNDLAINDTFISAAAQHHLRSSLAPAIPSPAGFFMSTTSATPSTASLDALEVEAPLGASVATFTHNMVKTLREYIGHERHDHGNHNVETGWGSSVSAEFFNFAMALMVYSVRYPSMFWATNKWLGIIFSCQLFINGVQTLLAFAGMSILYKVQVIGPWKTLPLLKHQPGGLSPSGGLSPFLLNPQVTLALYLLSILLVLSSSLVLYLYGHTRFNSFLNRQRQRVAIELKEAQTSTWATFTHCAALCVLLSVGLCNGPLLYDYTVVYKGSLDTVILICIIGGNLHLVIWIVLWLFLTIKQKWEFKLRVTVAKATFADAPTVQLVTDLDLQRRSAHSADPAVEPLVVVGHGQTYIINDLSPKRAIMSVVRKQATVWCKYNNGTASSTSSSRQDRDDNRPEDWDETATTGTADDEEQIYWLKPAVAGDGNSGDETPEGSQLCWGGKKSKSKGAVTQGGGGATKVVTFDDENSTSCRNGRSGSKSSNGQRRRMPGVDIDDGDYATLAEVTKSGQAVVVVGVPEDNISEEGKLLACVHDEHVTYASTSQDLVPPADYEDPSPLLTPEPFEDKDESHKTPISVIVHNHAQTQGAHTTRCLRRADSGMPHDELTPRSDSISTTESSSCSPPDPPGSNHSETSSGIHSNDSNSSTGSTNNDHHNQPSQTIYNPTATIYNPATTIYNPPNTTSTTAITVLPTGGMLSPPLPLPLPPPPPPTRRATSVLELANAENTIHWKSASLQRNMQPPSGPAGNHCDRQSETEDEDDYPRVRLGSGGAAVESIYASGPQYVNHSEIARHGVIMEDGSDTASVDSTVVIRRKVPRPKMAEPPVEIPGRATNMRMTSFTESLLNNTQASSATLPHYPTQPSPLPNNYPHCSTMPLPHHTTGASSTPASAYSSGGALNHNHNPPAQQQQQQHRLGNYQPQAGAVVAMATTPAAGTNSGVVVTTHLYQSSGMRHTTIPTHHNGVRLFGNGAQTGSSNSANNPYIKRLQQQGGTGMKITANVAEHIYTGINRNSGEIYHYSS